MRMDAFCYKHGFILCLYIFIIFISLFDSAVGTGTQCSPSENVKWNKNKQKCVQCPKCYPGHFRNLTEPYTRREGIHGAERCIKCRRCPEGTYSKDGYGECAKCRLNCTKLHREFAESCSYLHDAKCGSCLSGFDDIFKNTQFPCGPKTKNKKLVRILKPPKKAYSEDETLSDKKHGSVASTRSNQDIHPDPDVDKETTDGMGMKLGSTTKGTSTVISGFVLAVILATGGVLVFSSIGFATYRVYNRNRSLQRVRTDLNNQGNYNRVTDLSQDNDIEMDTFALTDETGTTRYHQVPQMEPAAVRPELDSSAQLYQPSITRAELTQHTPTDNLDGLIYIALPGSPSDVYRYERHKDICPCRSEQRCMCTSYNFSEDINIEKSDRYVLEVAANICHDPFELFRCLGIGDPIIYQENNSRDRDPLNISQKDLVINVLHRWIEVRPTPTSLKQLSIALCQAEFHRINEIINELHIKNIPES